MKPSLRIKLSVPITVMITLFTSAVRANTNDCGRFEYGSNDWRSCIAEVDRNNHKHAKPAPVEAPLYKIVPEVGKTLVENELKDQLTHWSKKNPSHQSSSANNRRLGTSGTSGWIRCTPRPGAKGLTASVAGGASGELEVLFKPKDCLKISKFKKFPRKPHLLVPMKKLKKRR